jgi:DNA-binding response OmpR family regulator
MTLPLETTRRRRLLVVEDDPDQARLARLYLEDEGFSVRVEHDATRAYDVARSIGFDLMVLDGLEICRALRNESNYVPIIVVTAKDSELDRVLGLELGADDYLTKPVAFRELVARVRSIFRRIDAVERAGTPEAHPLALGELLIDPVRHVVELAGVRIELTAKEFDLLHHFASHPGRVFTRNELVEAVWGTGYDGYDHTVNSHINRLRGKISASGPRQRYVETVWGVGYRFAEPKPLSA